MGFYISTTGFVVTLIKWYQERAEKGAQKAKREAAESELRENRRRSDGPHLALVHLRSVGPSVVPVGQAVGHGQDRLPALNSEVVLVVLNLHRTVFDVGFEWIGGDSTGRGLVVRIKLWPLMRRAKTRQAPLSTIFVWSDWIAKCAFGFTSPRRTA